MEAVGLRQGSEVGGRGSGVYQGHQPLTAPRYRSYPRPLPPWSRTDSLIVVALFLFGLLLALPVTVQRLDLQDDGLYMHQANIILQGGVPYRDYLQHDPPLGNAWHALMLALFGNDVLVLRLASLPFKALLLACVFALSRPLVPRGPALLAALVVPVVDTGSFYTVAHVAINALGLGAAGVVLLMVWARRRDPIWLFGAGMVLGVMAGFKQNMGLYLLAGAALWLVDPLSNAPASGSADDRRRTTDDRVQRFVVRGVSSVVFGLWSAAAAGVLWLVHANLEPTVLVSLILPVLALAVATLRRHGESRLSLREVPARWATLAGGFLVTALPWLGWTALAAGLPELIHGLLVAPSRLPEIWFAPLRPPVPAFWWVLGLYLGGGLIAAVSLALARLLGGRRAAPFVAWGSLAAWFAALALLTPVMEYAATGLIYIWLYFNLLVFWPAFLLIERLPAGGLRTHARLLLLSATFLALEMYPQLRRIQANWCFPLFLPLAAWVLWGAARWLRRLALPSMPRITALVPAAAAALLPALAIWWILDWRISQVVDLPTSLRTGSVTPVVWKRLDLPHFRIWDTPDNQALYHRMADAITSRTRPGEPIYCFYRPVALYLATGRPPAVRNVYAPPEITVEEARDMSEELRRAGVRVIVSSNSALDPSGPWDEFSPGRVVEWAVPIRDYIVGNYRKVEDLSVEWSVWERNVK